PELRRLYADYDSHHLVPLWTQIGDLMPHEPAPAARPHVWRWTELYPLAQRAGDLVPVGRGGERRAIALANPGLQGKPYISPTLWAAIQYLGPRETAPEHRHSQSAFRFVVEGEGVWTVVNGDPVRMSRGDLLLTPGWHFHGHHNDTDHPNGVDRRAGHPAGALPGRRFLRIRQQPGHRRRHPQSVARGTRLVPSRAAAGLSAARHGRQPGDRLPLGAHRRRAHSAAVAG